MPKSYIFKVNGPKEIDLARISRENPETEVLIVTGINDQPSTDARLLISNDFLSCFVTGDGIRIDAELLCPKWGLAKIEDGVTQSERTQFHRWIHIGSERIPNVIMDVRKAKNYLKKLKSKHTIKVTKLDNSDKPKPSTRPPHPTYHCRPAENLSSSMRSERNGLILVRAQHFVIQGFVKMEIM